MSKVVSICGSTAPKSKCNRLYSLNVCLLSCTCEIYISISKSIQTLVLLKKKPRLLDLYDAFETIIMGFLKRYHILIGSSVRVFKGFLCYST